VYPLVGEIDTVAGRLDFLELPDLTDTDDDFIDVLLVSFTIYISPDDEDDSIGSNGSTVVSLPVNLSSGPLKSILTGGGTSKIACDVTSGFTGLSVAVATAISSS